MKFVGLLGNNIGYSKSPNIHNKYYKSNNVDFYYKLFDIEKKDIDDFIEGLKENNIMGFNVTIPYKQYIIKYLDKIEYPADKINAVNTVVLCNEQLIGYNTDYYGFVKSLEDRDINVENFNALIIGNGGAAKAVFYALKDLKVKSIDIIGRDVIKIKNEFSEANNIYSLNKKLNLSKHLIKYDLIINATPLGGSNFNDIIPIEFTQLDKDTIVYDLNYTPEKTRFLMEAEKCGATIINGMDMLLNQGYKAIEIWLSNTRKQGDKK